MRFPLVWRRDYERAIVDRDNWQAAFKQVSVQYEKMKNMALGATKVQAELLKVLDEAKKGWGDECLGSPHQSAASSTTFARTSSRSA